MILTYTPRVKVSSFTYIKRIFFSRKLINFYRFALLKNFDTILRFNYEIFCFN